jgi:hypothetical protein
VLVTPRIVKPLESSQVPAPPYFPSPFMPPAGAGTAPGAKAQTPPSAKK